MLDILIVVGIVAAIGLICALILIIASKYMHVETNEKEKEIRDVLPGANCGACGFAGCADYAAAIVQKGAATNLCRPGGADAAGKIAAILGTAAAEVVPMTAVVHCSGDCDATSQAFYFDGVQSCKAVKRFYGGNGMCKYGCIGLGDCMKVCERDAIKLVNGIARVTPALCGACGQCVAACPNQLISIKPVSKRIDVLCSSGDNGKTTKLVCKNGCIGCKICEKKCPNEAIIVNNFHASIDYNKCTNCGACMEACPVKVIHSCDIKA